jgi:hypothetical protein
VYVTWTIQWRQNLNQDTLCLAGYINERVASCNHHPGGFFPGIVGGSAGLAVVLAYNSVHVSVELSIVCCVGDGIVPGSGWRSVACPVEQEKVTLIVEGMNPT